MNLKKIISIGVVTTTIMWSLGIATLIPSIANAIATSCPTLAAGDMLKISGKSAVYALDDNLNYLYFPDGDVFKSWNANDSYNIYYKVIAQSCFDSLTQPASPPYHVFYRNGSYLVKNSSSDTLYVVGLGNKLYPITDTAAKAIYGTNYYYKTIGLSEWPLYTKDATTITQATVYPGMLARAGGLIFFVNEDKILREVTGIGFETNRFKQAFIRTLPISAIEDLPRGSAIDSEVTSLTKRINYSKQNSQTTTPSSINYPFTFSGSLNLSYNAGESMMLRGTVLDNNGVAKIEVLYTRTVDQVSSWSTLNTCYNTNYCNGNIVTPSLSYSPNHYFKMRACDNLGNCEYSPVYITYNTPALAPTPAKPIIEFQNLINHTLGDGFTVKTRLSDNSQMYSFQMFKSVDNINFDQVAQCSDSTSCSVNEITNNNIRKYYFKSRVCNYSSGCIYSDVYLKDN